MLPNPYVRWMAALVVSSLTALAGEVQTGQAIVFEESDFASSKTASKPWIIHRPSSSEDTAVWEVSGPMRQDTDIDDGRLLHAPNAKDGNVVWKVTVPSGYLIKDFTWAVDGLALAGIPDGDDDMVIEFSSDGKTWVEVLRKRNHRTETGDPSWLRKQIFFEKLSKSGTNELFLRLRHIEGPVPDDAAYFAIWSKFTEGGEEPNSYVEVSVARK